MDMVHKDIDVLLGHLTSGGVDQELKSELMYMRTILKFQQFVFCGYLGDSITAKILEERLFYSPSCRTSKECMVNYVDSLVSFIIQKGRSSSFHTDTSMGDASKFLESLFKNLQSIKKATRRCLSTSTLVPIEILEENLRVLIDSLHFKVSTAQQEYLLTRIQALAESAADLCFTFWVKMSDHFLDTDEISHLLYLRNICKERVPPLEINTASQMVLLDDQILDICKRLELVKGLLMNLPKQYLMQDKTKDLLRQIAALTSKTRYHSLEEDMAVRVNDELHILLKNSKEICLDVRNLLHSGFPLTEDCGMIDSLVMSLNGLLNFKADLANKHEIEKLKTVIELWKKCGSFGKHRERVFKTAYEAAYIIDSMNLNNDPPPYLESYLSDIIAEADIIYNETLDIGFLNVVKSSNPLSSVVNTPIGDNVLGFKKEEEAIKEQLLSGPSKLDVISIVGVSGLGKTTLANKIYNDQNVINHFHVRAWCCVSQEYNMTKLLCEIYSQVTEDELTDEMQRLIKENREAKVTEVDLAEKFSKCVVDKKTRRKVTESDVAEKLQKFLKELKEKRYLIVLDDIWESRAYEEITRCFPTVENGSRIMLTSRFDEVAHKLKLHSDPHNLPFFTKEERWELLQWKVFRNECCYPELLEIGEEISESYRGLPLFIVMVAGLLTSIKKEERLWSEVAKSLSSVASEHEILGLIYEHLPDRWKSCLLFFAAFPKDQEIAVSKLVQLWAAEGFIEKIEGKSLEDVAEDYLSNLLSGGLITVSKRRYDGSIISCRVHNTIHEFCLEKAKKERFLMISSTNDQIPIRGMACHRICFNHQDIECHNPLYSRIQWSPSVRTILCTYRRREPHISKAIDFSQIYRRSRLIRVLDLESITVGNTFFSVIEHLPHLRFIAAHTGYCNFVLPSSLGNPHNLETFKIKTENQSVVLPKAILNMVKLRQLDITDSFQFGIDKDDSCLKNIQALSTVLLPNKQSIDAMIIRFPYLRRLKCIYVGSNESSPESNEFLDLEKLDQLEFLHVSYDGPLERRDLIVFKFPWCLTKLILNGFSLPACEIFKFALIPTLVALKLQNVHFKDHQWDVEECDFPQLNYLKLQNCSIVYWSALTSSFPCLKRLILRRCIILKEVPSCFGNIATLEAVEVYRCNSSLEDSVLKIQSESTNRSSPLVIRILKSDDLQIFYSPDAKKCSAGVSQLPENVDDKTKAIIRLKLHNQKERAKALRIAFSMAGVESVSLEQDKLVAIGNFDIIGLACELRRRLSFAETVSIEEIKRAGVNKTGDEKPKQKGIGTDTTLPIGWLSSEENENKKSHSCSPSRPPTPSSTSSGKSSYPLSTSESQVSGMKLKRMAIFSLKLHNQKAIAKALVIATCVAGVVSVGLEEDKLVAIGDFDLFALAKQLRKGLSFADLLSIEEIKRAGVNKTGDEKQKQKRIGTDTTLPMGWLSSEEDENKKSHSCSPSRPPMPSSTSSGKSSYILCQHLNPRLL
ncbi:putative late blight resistance protein homolog R1B-23 isoform X2 [Ipomoea triloba]|uniref:putative late blight resistance protein homolog R1B-23 isoform X2 n=1 Tax=Ipomoea triloba TaxID=35885 RepID=UPI00125E55BE|nr:putative late blight resistance protein homolog R1B-23 isoform X2 [Ipomoea triloba]